MSLNPRAAGKVNSASLRWSWSEPPMSVPRLKIEDSNSASSVSSTSDVYHDYRDMPPIQRVPEPPLPWSDSRNPGWSRTQMTLIRSPLKS